MNSFFHFSRFDRVCRMFCEDPTTTQSDEFFGIFDHFITSFAEAKMDNDNAKKKKEEEEKIAKQHQEVIITRLKHKSNYKYKYNLNSKLLSAKAADLL